MCLYPLGKYPVCEMHLLTLWRVLPGFPSPAGKRILCRFFWCKPALTLRMNGTGGTQRGMKGFAASLNE
jgi:hypothetical protein